MITVATWNVLHRIHAENWDEDVLRCWPDETKRIAAVTARLAERTERVIALQEVSGDQLASLRRALPHRTVHVLRYPRVPVSPYDSDPLRDPGEHLVLLVDGASQTVAAESFADARGKGMLAVRVSDLLVVAVHLSVDRRRIRQLPRVAELVESLGAHPAVVLGDFNADRATVASGLGDGFAVADLPPDAPPTRPGSTSPNIDHVAARGAVVTNVTVDDADGLSDHNLVRATIAAVNDHPA